MNVVKYDYPSSSTQQRLVHGGTAPLEGSVDFPSDSSDRVLYWKCPNCGYCIWEKIAAKAGSGQA
jgi:hypothetical protein